MGTDRQDQVLDQPTTCRPSNCRCCAKWCSRGRETITRNVKRVRDGVWPDNVSVLSPVSASFRGTVTIPPGLIPSDVPKPHETATMERLAALGFDVDFNRVSHADGVKNPDVTMEMKTWELKSPLGNSPNTIGH